MNPARDVLYRVHQVQAERRQRSALAYEDFCARLRNQNDTDLTGLLLPPPQITVTLATVKDAKFDLGQVRVTSDVASQIPVADMVTALCRHAAGDWGIVEPLLRQANDTALQQGGNLLSCYLAGNGSKFWVLTIPKRNTTQVLISEEC